MRVGYKTVNVIAEGVNFILVSNFARINEVANLGFSTEKTVHRLKSSSTPGFWRIKGKE
jgi:hypothetical protein